MKKILLVDLDDTLLDFRKTSDEAIVSVFNYHNIPVSKENLDKYDRINRSYWEKYERKEISRDVILNERFSTFFNDFGINTDGKIENRMYFDGLKNIVIFVNNALPFLSHCKKLGMTICLVSNGVNEVQESRLKLSSIDKYLDNRYISEFIGYAKPDVNFFKAIEKDFPNKKEEMVILGDSLSSDIQGGKNFNITTVWFNPRKQKSVLPDYSISDLLDFFSLDIMK